MEAEIRPDPTPEERAAILAALERMSAEESPNHSAWRELGIRENIDDDGADALD